MKKVKDPIAKRWTKLRAAIRNVWRYDESHREVIKSVLQFDPEQGRFFICPLCKTAWPIDRVRVDHNPPLGGFNSWETFFTWTRNCFEGPRRGICKTCHDQVTAAQRRKKAS